MSNNLSALEEFDAQRKIEMPHLLYSATDLVAKKNIAYVVLAKKEKEILLISPAGFGEAAVVAGFSEKNIEHFAKFASKECKERMFEVIKNDLLAKDIWEIAEAMDDDLGRDSKSHRQRVRKVLQYIYNNQTVFHF